VLVRACGNCHSNHTEWPWYSHVAPVSWWIAQHVREGREKLDFSGWEKYRHGKSATNWSPCADSYRRARCPRGRTPQCMQRRNLLKAIRKLCVPGERTNCSCKMRCSHARKPQVSRHFKAAQIVHPLCLGLKRNLGHFPVIEVEHPERSSVPLSAHQASVLKHRMHGFRRVKERP